MYFDRRSFFHFRLLFLHKFPHSGIVHPEDDGNWQKLSPCASPPNRPPPEYKFPFHLIVSDGLPIYLRLRDEQQSRKAQPNLCPNLSFQRLQTKTKPNTIVHPDPAISTQEIQIQSTAARGLCVWTPRNERRPWAIGRFPSPPSQGYQRHAHHRTPSPPSTCARAGSANRMFNFLTRKKNPIPRPLHFTACALSCASNARIRASSLSALFCWRAAQWRPPSSSSSSSSASRYGGGAKPDGL